MNKVFLTGRLTKDPELRTVSNNNTVCQFSIAVDRIRKDAQGNKKTDFFNCVAWNGTGELVHKYFTKGRKILLTGEINNRDYQRQDGTKNIITEIIVDSVEFIDSQKQTNYNRPSDVTPLKKFESTGGEFKKPNFDFKSELDEPLQDITKFDEEDVEAPDPFS